MKIPTEIIALFESETEGLLHGEVFLTCLLRDGNPRYEVGRKRSVYPQGNSEKRKKHERS
jgi:hypothetical protein